MSETITETAANIAENEKSAKSQNDSMEELKFDDEDEKNVSVEDILGGKSLLMSDSEQELSPVKKATKEIENNETSALSEDAQVPDHEANPHDEEVDELEIQKLVPRKKISALVDSDSETENTTNSVEEQHSEEDANENKTKQVTRKKAFALIDSESEEEKDTPKDIDDDEEVKVKNKKRFALVDSESEQEDKSTTKLNKKNKKTKKDNGKSAIESKKLKKKSKKKVKQITSGSEQESNNNEKSTQSKQKQSGLVDSDSEQSNNSSSDAESNHSQNEGEMEQDSSKGKSKKVKKPIRESAKKAMNDMQAIQSEQQRLHREMHISVPYHQPKRHTLQEFLNRRSISKPIEILSPSAVKQPPKNLKMSAEELEAYAKLMEERAKEATEFFKSESEDDENEEQNEFETNSVDPANVGAASSIENEYAEFTTNTAEEGFSDDDMELKDNLGVMDVEFPEASNTDTANNILIETAPNIETETAPNIETETAPNIETETAPNIESETAANIESETAANVEAETPLNIETELLSTSKETDDFNIPIEKSLIEDNHNHFNMSIDNEELPSTSSNSAIVTEVIDLPRIDISTLNISPPKPLTISKPSDQLKQLVMEKSAQVSPVIKGDANMVIDLETGDMYTKKPTGVDTLFQRLLKTREHRKAKEKETVSILSTENGKLEITKVDIATNKETDPKKEPKPGAAYQQLKQSLKSIIYQKRLQKKMEEELEHNKCLNDDDDEETGEAEYEPENKPKMDLQIDDEENEICVNDDEEIVEHEVELDDNEEHDEEDEENLELAQEKSEDDNESDEDEDSENKVEESQRKNRIIRAFVDDSSDDEVDFLKTPTFFDPSPVTATQLQLSATKLFDAEEKRSASDEENELLNLCSGQFSETQMGNADECNKTEAIISQMPMTQNQVGDIAEAADELMELCSGAFETQKPTETISENLGPRHVTKILSSSDEEANDNKDSEFPERQQRTKKFSKKMKKKKFNLGFSDDENDSEDEKIEQLTGSENDDVDDEVEVEVEKADEDEEAEDIPQTYVDYDSEENEIVVELTKKDRVMRASNFVENEAELSESEWGSADEDEKQMDNYDMELGDEDEFDQQKLRSELEQIHARKMLDQDIREVKKIQEMLFEDEELDGVGRQRQFKWKNAESGFTLDDNRNEDGEGNGENSEDEENEHMWRKKRFEREQLLLEKGLKEDPSSTVLIASPLATTLANVTLNNGGTPMTGGSTIRKLNIITAKKKTVEAKKNSPFLISKTITANAIQQQKNVRGSFLVRDKETLTKLAGLTKGPGGLNDADGSLFTVSVKSAKAKNFVFATLTEEEHENQKRKADELLNSSSETGINYMKKRPRIEPKREKCLIDQLL